MRRVRRIPVPLALLLAVAFVTALAWIVALPAFQGPDEVSHVAYVQRIVDAHQIPFRKGRDAFPPGTTEDSSEVALTGTWAGLGPLRGNPDARPFWTKPDEVALPAQARGPATDGAHRRRLLELVSQPAALLPL